MEERKKIMEIRRLLDFLKTAEQLKCNTRHSYTSNGRLESVAEHSWRLALMAMLVGDEFSELDMDKVIKMCLIHDMGEAITGDIPAFEKTDKDRKVENKKVEQLMDNEADISTWIPLEYDLQMTYGNEECKFTEYIQRLRDEVRKDSKRKIEESKQKD